MEEYGLVAIGINFFVDFLLLMASSRLSGYPSSPGRSALGAAVGALFGFGGLNLAFLGHWLWRLVCLGLMGAAAFGLNGSCLPRLSVYGILSLALGGIALRFGRGEVLPLAVSGVFLWVLCLLGFGNRRHREYLPVRLKLGENTVTVLALRDTGNTLRDPVTGEQVLVLSGEAAARLTGLTLGEIRSPLETLARRPLPGLRLVPYRAVGSDGLLLAMRIPEVTVHGRCRSAVVAFAPTGFSDTVQALTGGVL